MILDTFAFADEVRRQLGRAGYIIQTDTDQLGPDCASSYWFTWSAPDQSEPLLGPACRSEWEAWAGALTHCLSRYQVRLLDQALTHRLPANQAMGPFHPAQLPDSVLDADAIAARFDISLDIAQAQVERLRRQTVYLNDRYQVNTEVVSVPFGDQFGDILWLSIKRRDRLPIHDWRDLQAIKNALVGEDREGFEIYPAESRLTDTANQYHLWVFLDPTVRLPVGFDERQVLDAAAAAQVGAIQRDLDFPD